jgi:predicted Zn-dependent protease with MMP-like domain
MVQVTPERFEELVADALDAVPAELASAVENVAVIVADWPPREDRGGGGVLLGRYEGVPLTRRDPTRYAGVAPDRITIFQGPLCARATDEADLAAQVRTTVLHEIGHYFGLSDARLRDLGWA